MIPNLPYADLNTFNIHIGCIRAGWMEITLEAQGNEFLYNAGYCTNPIDEILKATVSVLYNLPFHIRSGWHLLNHAFAIHDREPLTITWLFHCADNLLTIAVWDDLNQDILEDLCHSNFKYRDFITDHDDYPDLKMDLMFAVQGDALLFAKKLMVIFEELDTRKKQNKWGYNYSIEYFDKLNAYIQSRELFL